MKNTFSIIQKLAFVYAVMFILVAALSYIPAVKDIHGYVFGLFSLQYFDDLLHVSSGLWALGAGLKSTKSAAFYFKVAGFLYFLDAVLGLLSGQGFLDFGIFQKPLGVIDLSTRIGANGPHILIGGFALYIGCILSRKYVKK